MAAEARALAAPGCGHLRRLGRCCGLLEVLEAALQLGRVELLRAPAEPSALQLPDQEPQLVDLGLCRIALRPSSIAFGLQRYERGILLCHDLSHLLQHLQQPIWITWKIIQRQHHGGIILASRQANQHYSSPGRARPPHRAGLQPIPR